MESSVVHVYSGSNGNARSSGVGKNQRYSMYWTLEKEILLIKYFEQHRYMWDTNHILFHKREPRMQGFSELVELLGIDEGTIRQRWSSMRSQFCREERKVSLCPTYIPTWDHYSALQFLRKPFEEPRGQNPDNLISEVVPEPQVEEVADDMFADSPQSGHDHSLDETHRPSGFRVSRIADQLAVRLTGQYENSPQYEDEKDDSSYAATTNTPPPLDIKTEPPSEAHIHIPSSIAQAPTPSQLIRKYKTPRQRRWTPAYNKKYQEISSMASASMNIAPPPPLEQSRTTAENDAFVQYISNVLERFPPDKQRRCRNELLCIILKYDTLEDDVAISPASHE